LEPINYSFSRNHYLFGKPKIKYWMKELPGYLLILELIGSSFNIVPVLVIPIFFGVLLLIFYFLIDRAYLVKIKNTLDFRLWFLLYILVCIVYAKIIGVDIFSFSLFRREFKFVFPFVFLITYSSFLYSDEMKRRIIYSLFFISSFSLAWLMFGFLDPKYHNTRLYPFEGFMWEHVSGGPSIYLGPFITHSAAGGFYGTMTLLFLGIYVVCRNYVNRSLFFLAIIVNTVCLCLTDSRAFMFSTALISGFTGLFYLIKSRNPKNSIIKPFQIIAAPVIILIILATFHFIEGHGGHLDIANILNKGLQSSIAESKKSDARLYYSYLRFYLWKIAIEDLEKSPLIGVGPSRFDDDSRVLATIPKHDIDKGIISLPTSSKSKDKYFQIPFVRVNIGQFVAHTDQHPHNVYLDVLSEGGVALFSIFIFMYFRMLTSIYCERNSNLPENFALLNGVIYSFSGVGIASFFGNNLLTVIPMMTIFSIVSLLAGSQRLPSQMIKD